MEEFVLLIKGQDNSPVSPEKLQKRLGNYRAWMEKWMENGQYLAGTPLDPPASHLVNKNTITQPAASDHKDIIGGYIKIKAQSLSEATEIAKECPLLEEFEILIHPVANYGA